MKPLTAQDPETKTPNLAAENRAKLKALFPDAVTEDGVNVDVLKQLIGQTVTDTEEKYGLNWHGKRKARQLALTPSTGTLRPCPEDSVAWETTRNLMIEGDNLEVLKLLQKSYAGKVKLICIDPPYNTGNDFIYPDDFANSVGNYLMLTGQIDSDGRKISTNTDVSGRFHTDWLNMIYPRLKLARNLLSDEGVMFVSIDDAELANLVHICKECFGEENILPIIIRRAKIGGGSDNKHVAKEADYIVAVAKSSEKLPKFYMPHNEKDLRRYNQQDSNGKFFWDTYSRSGLASDDPESDSLYYEVKFPDGSKRSERWRRSEERLKLDLLEGEAKFVQTTSGWNIHFKQRLNEDGKRPRQILFDGMGNTAGGDDIESVWPGLRFPYPKPCALISFFIEIANVKDGIILDFFAGSGTTAHAAISLNAKDGGERRFIVVQLPEATDLKNYPTIAEITKERLRRAGNKIREEWEAKQSAASQEPELPNSQSAVAEPQLPDLGFRVFKLASSNIQAWEPDRERLAETLEASVDHLKTDRTESDILFELLLKLGLDLTVPIETRIINPQMAQMSADKAGEKIAFNLRASASSADNHGLAVHSIGAGTLIVCLAKSITAQEVEPLALGIAAWHKAQAPAGESTIVFRDSAFADDVAKTNLTAILQQHGLENVRSL